MKKKIFTFLSLASVALTINAQTITSLNYFNASGLTQKVDTMPAGGIVPGSSGSAQTYDFSTLNSHLTSTSAYIAPASGLNGSSYPMSNVCMHQDTMYVYLDSSSTKVDMWGLAGNLLQNGADNAQVYSNPQTVITFPSILSSSFTDTAEYDSSFPYMDYYMGFWVDSLRKKETIITTSTMDGAGTVITPNRTYTSCLRQNVLKHSVDSTWAKIVVGGLHYWINLTGDTSNTQSYSYITDSVVGPVVNIQYYPDSSAIYQVRWNSLELSAITAQTNSTCNGDNNGTASATVSGGTLPYTYAWSTGPVQTTATATGLSAGSYTLAVIDAATQTITATLTITEPTTLTASVSASTNVLCYGNSTGDATASGSGGTTPYAYLWNSAPAQNTATATGLIAGDYVATVTDANGCIATNSVTITEPAAALTATVTASTNVLCRGLNTGDATASGSGGTGTLTYSWNTSPVQNTATAAGLAAGNYIVTVTDANSCATTASVTITQPASAVSASLTSLVNVLCRGNSTGSLGVTASGGTGTLTYLWNDAGAQTTATATGLAAGSYTATVTDANGCAKLVTATITQPATVVTASVTASANVNCNGGNNGSATASGSGGTGAISYSWNTTPAQNTATATGLIAGDYIATATDANGCASTASVTITEPGTAVTASITASANVQCNGGNDGGAVAAGGGGTGSFTYLWNDPGAQTTAIATGFTAADYVVTATDGNGCASTASVTITEPTAVTASVTATTDATCSNSDGTATVTASGGTGTLAYFWNDPGMQTTATATGLSAAIYTVTVTDANGCFLNDIATISNIGAATVSVTATTDVTCNGGSNGDATATASGGTGTLTYSWNTSPAQATLVATGLTAGVYDITVTDGAGCITIQSATINEPTAVVFAAPATTNVLCKGGANGDATASASGGTGSIGYAWNTTPAQNTATATGLIAGDYIATATDGNGCAATSTVTITEPTAVVFAAPATTNVLCNGGANGDATASASGGTGSIGYTWNTSPAQNTATATGLIAGDYVVTATDANSCAATATVTITEPAAALSAVVTAIDESICGTNDGSVTASVTGGTGTYTYAWSNLETTASITGLAADTFYVAVTDANGCAVAGNDTVFCTTSVINAQIESKISVYPNPSLGEFNIELNYSVSNNYTIELSNVLGQLMYSETLTNFSGKYTKHFDMKKYGEGIYFMSVRSKDSQMTRKVIVY
ncbi:MAG: T9SS type A sorting domain-containing protein [Bacteroidetes bacterium]|nr:T9SS type A sorting domain-containing protein [Bacteroidota bacterium]